MKHKDKSVGDGLGKTSARGGMDVFQEFCKVEPREVLSIKG